LGPELLVVLQIASKALRGIGLYFALHFVGNGFPATLFLFLLLGAAGVVLLFIQKPWNSKIKLNTTQVWYYITWNIWMLSLSELTCGVSVWTGNPFGHLFIGYSAWNCHVAAGIEVLRSVQVRCCGN
jgi:hypothetical protein